MERVDYAHWGRCARLANGAVDLLVTTGVGPRIIRFGFLGRPNVFAEFPEQIGKAPGEWQIYGGHRLWHAPEAKPRTYSPDNRPVQVEERAGGLVVTQPVEPDTGIEKQMEIRLDERRPRARVLHRLRNRGPWPVTLAPWALSVMEPGGVAVVPQPERATPDRLLPNRAIALWPYTNMQDPRVTWGERYVRLRQDRRATGPIKFGITAYDNWAAYVNGGTGFLKTFRYRPEATYPDYGSGVECYTNADFLEVETLGPLVTLEPGAATEHLEVWHLLRDADAGSDAAIDRTLAAHARAALAEAAERRP